MSASVFLDVVVIMSGLAMAIVALIIFYKKYPDIADEFREIFGLEWLKLGVKKDQSQTVEQDEEIDVEAPGVDNNVSTAPAKQHSRNSNNPFDDDSCLGLSRTAESPASSRDNDESTLDVPRPNRLNVSMSIASEDDYVAKYMKNRNNTAVSPSDKSGSLTCSVYLDDTYTYPDQQSISIASSDSTEDTRNIFEHNKHYFNSSPYSKCKLSTAAHSYRNKQPQFAVYQSDTEENDPLNYSMDTMLTEEQLDQLLKTQTLKALGDSFSSLNEISKPNPSSSDMGIHHHYSEESCLAADEDVLVEHNAGTIEQSYSPLDQRKVNFSSQVLSESSCGGLTDCGKLSNVEDSNDDPHSMPINRNNDPHSMPINRIDEDFSMPINKINKIHSMPIKENDRNNISKPKLNIVTRKSILGNFSNDSMSDDSDARWVMTVKKTTVQEVSPTYTEATAGLWSPSSDASSFLPPSEGPSDESFGSRSHVVCVDDLSQRSSEDKEDAADNVHVCKSAICTACRDLQKAQPQFVPAASSNSMLRPRIPPKRWWMDDQKFKGYISSVILPVSNHLGFVPRERENEAEIPFDETL